MNPKKIVLKISEDDDQVAYLYLPKHPKVLKNGIVKKTIWLSDLLPNYTSTPIYLDFDENDELIGIEIVG